MNWLMKLVTIFAITWTIQLTVAWTWTPWHRFLLGVVVAWAVIWLYERYIEPNVDVTVN